MNSCKRKIWRTRGTTTLQTFCNVQQYFWFLLFFFHLVFIWSEYGKRAVVRQANGNVQNIVKTSKTQFPLHRVLVVPYRLQHVAIPQSAVEDRIFSAKMVQISKMNSSLLQHRQVFSLNDVSMSVYTHNIVVLCIIFRHQNAVSCYVLFIQFGVENFRIFVYNLQEHSTQAALRLSQPTVLFHTVL